MNAVNSVGQWSSYRASHPLFPSVGEGGYLEGEGHTPAGLGYLLLA